MAWFRKKKNKKKELHEGETELEPDPIEDEPLEESEPEESPLAADIEIIEEEPPPDEPVIETDQPQRAGYFSRLRGKLSKTRRNLTKGFDRILADKLKIDDEILEDLEELLITSDIGVQTAMELIERISSAKVLDTEELKAVLKNEIISLLESESKVTTDISSKPHVIMVVGVNGVGKTTTIGKLAARSTAAGKKVLIAAADTFRAAAVEQLTIWADRAGADIVRHKEGADPAAVAYDAVEAAIARGMDIVIVDTAGRLHTKVNLMEELKKIKRSIAKILADAPHEILLVLDATTGQNALSQASLFDEAIDLTGLALTKLDGTAKGGIVIAICSTLNVPLQYIGIGEKIEDLQDFDSEQFVDALFSSSNGKDDAI